MNKESWNQIWPNAHNWPEPTKSNTLRCDLPLIANSMQKTNILNNSFQRNCWSKNPAIQFNKKFNWAHPTKNGSLRCYLPLMTNCMHKISIDSLQDIDNQRIKQSDCMKDKPGNIRSNYYFSRCCLCLKINSIKK